LCRCDEKINKQEILPTSAFLRTQQAAAAATTTEICGTSLIKAIKTNAALRRRRSFASHFFLSFEMQLITMKHQASKQTKQRSRAFDISECV